MTIDDETALGDQHGSSASGDVTTRPVSAEDYDSFPKYQEFLGWDRGKPPEFLFEHSTTDLGNYAVPTECYTSQDWHEREVEHLWMKTWQMVCRENDIPNIGDQLEYEILDQSILIVRAAGDDIRAFRNSCRHRGNRLLVGCQNAAQIQCGFHGWTWGLDGSLERIPCRWDFPEVQDDEYGLEKCNLQRWNGFVFINLDPDAAPLETHLGEEISSQLARWPFTHRWKAAHVAQVLPCNWKVALEAFLESYHVVRTHPDSLPYAADCATQYDFYGPHARLVTASGVPSAHLGEQSDPQFVMDALLSGAGAFFDHEIPALGPDDNARYVLADLVREMLQGQTGIDFTETSDAELLDGIEYFIFPNLVIWGGYFFPVVYRFRPTGNNPNSSIMEIMIVVPILDEVPLPPDMPLRWLAPDARFSDQPELGLIGSVLSQDQANLASMQRGLQSTSCNSVTLANYQERNIRNFHEHLAKVLDG